MYLSYDEAVQVGLNAYRTLEYASSCLSAFRVASREFREYLEDNDLSYSPELVQQWINDSKKYWNHSKFKCSKKALSVLADIMDHGVITTSLQTKSQRMPPYRRLPNWSSTLLDNYLETVNCSFGTSYLTQIRNACARFFIFLELAGVTQPAEITHDRVKFFFTQEIHISSKAKDRYDNEIRRCLMYMADQGLISKTIGLALNKFVIPDLLIVADLPEHESNRFSRFFNAPEKEILHSKAKFDAAAMQLTNLHDCRHYSPYIRKSDLQAMRDFNVFMDANRFAYSNELALEWLEFQRAIWSRVKYLTFRRVLLSIHEILRTGNLTTIIFSTHDSKYSLPEWGNDLLSQYLQERKREGCAASTLDMIKNSCSRFIVFLDRHGVISEKGITPEVVKNFQDQDHHRKVAGKNAYAMKIREFLRFLARKRLVTETLELAISTEMAPHTSIVTTLSDDQIDAIYTFRRNVDRPIGVRNTAIIMLGLRMGLRTSNIANLQLADISWKEGSISFIQQKTYQSTGDTTFSFRWYGQRTALSQEDPNVPSSSHCLGMSR